MQSASKNQVLDLPIDERLLQDFDQYVSHLFEVIRSQLGFESPMLFIHDEQETVLRSATGPLAITFPLSHPQSLLIKAYHTQELQASHYSQELFEGIVPEDTEQTNLFIAIPVIVFGESLGVLVVASTQQADVTKLEKVFLANFASQIGVHLFTAWTLKQLNSRATHLKKKNEAYKELIRVKKSFLLDVQELLLKQARLTSDEAEKNDALHALSYLNSLLILSEKAIEQSRK